jgi:phosphopantothenoylcysteine decarboxylase/phosphopantothenate--cysteine ligase
LNGKRIVLGVTGGIAAYKACEIVRRLREQGALVKVVMTRGAQAFVTPLSFQALSGVPVHTDLLDPMAEAAMGHIELARWAEALLIAPASADHLAKLRAGLADELLSTLVLATSAPVAVAPAMNQQMFANSATQENLQALAARGIAIWGPASGDQACGDVGPGRMLEASQLVERLISLLQRDKLLAGRRVLITAGPTREAIDPVRYISNHSSGKMGFALAQAAAALGAQVTLVAGPVELATPEGVQRLNVTTAEQMLAAVQREMKQQDIFIACAAVADYRLTEVATHKIKKTQETLNLSLHKNPDVLAWVAAQTPRPFCVGFAAETNDVVVHAQDKLRRKQLDLICANDVSGTLGFGSDDNAVTLINKHGEVETLSARPKLDLAFAILQRIAQSLT